MLLTRTHCTKYQLLVVLTQNLPDSAKKDKKRRVQFFFLTVSPELFPVLLTIYNMTGKVLDRRSVGSTKEARDSMLKFYQQAQKLKCSFRA